MVGTTVQGGALDARGAPPWRARPAFDRRLRLAGWSARSRWGYDPVLECYWAELWPEGPGGPRVVVGPEHLLTTPDALARTVARAAGVAQTTAYLALTA